MPARPPNIIFILMDDLGVRDLSCYGSEFYETPVLDRMAREGMRFRTGTPPVRCVHPRVQA